MSDLERDRGLDGFLYQFKDWYWNDHFGWKFHKAEYVQDPGEGEFVSLDKQYLTSGIGVALKVNLDEGEWKRVGVDEREEGLMMPEVLEGCHVMEIENRYGVSQVDHVVRVARVEPIYPDLTSRYLLITASQVVHRTDYDKVVVDLRPEYLAAHNFLRDEGLVAELLGQVEDVNQGEDEPVDADEFVVAMIETAYVPDPQHAAVKWSLSRYSKIGEVLPFDEARMWELGAAYMSRFYRNGGRWL